MALQPQITKKEAPSDDTLTVICIRCSRMVTAHRGQLTPSYILYPLSRTLNLMAFVCMDCGKEMNLQPIRLPM